MHVFLNALRQAHFPVGTDTALRLCALEQALSREELSASELRDWLAPLVACSPEQQQHFRAVFVAQLWPHWPHYPQAPEPNGPEGEKEDINGPKGFPGGGGKPTKGAYKSPEPQWSLLPHRAWVQRLREWLIGIFGRRYEVQLMPHRTEEALSPLRFRRATPLPPSARMRQLSEGLYGRESRGQWRFDPFQTVRATARSGGQFAPRFAPVAYPVEYLALVDKSHDHDHLARLFEALLEWLEAQGVAMDRFQYATDPRWLWNGRHPAGLGLAELQARYPYHRLLLLGDAHALLDLGTGLPHPWAQAFEAWPERVLLSPQSPFSHPEKSLAELFGVLLPSNPEGLGQLAALFRRAGGVASLQPPRPTEPPLSRRLRAEVLEDFLDKHFPENDERLWLAACALYPQLHWELSLRIGKELGLPLTYDRLYRLARLPYFQQGRMPDSVRLHLVQGPLFEANRERVYAVLVRIFLESEQQGEKIQKSHAFLQLFAAISGAAAEAGEHYGDVVVVNEANWRLRNRSIELPKEVLERVRRLRKQQSEVPPPTPAMPSTYTETVNGVSFVMKRIPAGSFSMGCTDEQGGECSDNAKPVHSVTLTQDYYLGETLVTQALWEVVMGNNPSRFKGAALPVENVSWGDTQRFITKLNAITTQKYRLPTEAEWEYAARGGTLSKNHKYSGSSMLSEVAWYYRNAGVRTYPVKQKESNELGLYDMNGNVWEWCQDWFGNYWTGSQTNPTGPERGSFRVIRGGGWFNDPQDCRVDSRNYFRPSNGYANIGFRLASQ